MEYYSISGLNEAGVIRQQLDQERKRAEQAEQQAANERRLRLMQEDSQDFNYLVLQETANTLASELEEASNLLDYVCDKIYDWHSDCDCHSVGPMRECIDRIEKFLGGR